MNAVTESFGILSSDYGNSPVASAVVAGNLAHFLESPTNAAEVFEPIAQPSDVTADGVLDASRLLRPLPVLRARRALKKGRADEHRG